jgi:hypothetical protein
MTITKDDLEAAFNRYYATHLAQANARTTAQKLAVLDTLERELREGGFDEYHR